MWTKKHRDTLEKYLWGNKKEVSSMNHSKSGADRDLPTMEQICAERKRLKHRAAYRKALMGTVEILLLIAAIAVLISTLLMPVLQITGESMEPTLKNGNIVLLLKTKQFQTGDICAFTWNNRTLVKRVIGTAGDWIEIDPQGVVYVNGHELEEPYVTGKSLGECDLTFPYQVPDGCLFLMGDHRETSIDSRNTIIGSVNLQQVIGKIVLRVWPLEQIDFVA